MKKKDYKAAIIAAHYHPDDTLVEAVMEDHAKLLDSKLVDGSFRRVYRPEELAPVEKPARGRKPAAEATGA